MKKTTIAYVMGLIMATLVFVGCGTPRIGPATTTLDKMEGVGQLTSIERETVVTPAATNVVMRESIKSKEQGQFELRMKELGGQTKVNVAEAKNRPVYAPTPTSYGGGYGGYPSGSYYPTYPSYNDSSVGHHQRGTVVTGRGEGGYNYTYHR